MRVCSFLAILALFWALATGCSDSTPADGDGDSDVDSDVDSDTDTDVDVDADSDADPDPCEGVECSGHGDCFTDGERAICVCDPGYHAAGLECIADGPDGDADADVDDDMDHDADLDHDPDVDGDADPDHDPDIDVECGWPCPLFGSGSTQQLRITALHISSPSSLANPLIQAILNASTDDFALLWLIELDLRDMTVVTGAGEAESIPPRTDRDFCNVSWNPDDPPASGAIITDDRGLIHTDEPLAALEIPIATEGDPHRPLMSLPLQQVELIDVDLSRPCMMIGDPGSPPGTDEYAAYWIPDGTVLGWMSWDDTDAVMIEDLGRTLCALLCGTAESSCRAVSPDDCPNPPEPIPGTWGIGYELVADIGGAAVTIH